MGIHEDDAARLQNDLDQLVIKHLGRVPLNLEDYELHASDIRNAKKPIPTMAKAQRVSIWAHEERSVRLDLLNEAYSLVASFRPTSTRLPITFFGVVVDSDFHSSWSPMDREQFAYEVLLNKFDVMLKKSQSGRQANKGLVIHDRRVVAERDIQSWTSGWRVAAGKVGQLRNLADVPLFADSRASRLLQVADLLAYALYRRYNPDRIDDRYFKIIWPQFAPGGRDLHNCAHYTPDYGSGSCQCEPCTERLKLEAAKAARPSSRRRR